MKEFWNKIKFVWLCGGGLAMSLIMLAVLSWRAAIVTLALWMISLIYGIYVVGTKD